MDVLDVYMLMLRKLDHSADELNNVFVLEPVRLVTAIRMGKLVVDVKA